MAGVPVAVGGVPVAVGGVPVAVGRVPVAVGGVPVAVGGVHSILSYKDPVVMHQQQYSQRDVIGVLLSAGCLNVPSFSIALCHRRPRYALDLGLRQRGQPLRLQLVCTHVHVCVCLCTVCVYMCVCIYSGIPLRTPLK